jgi:serine/threonine protein kinase
VDENDSLKVADFGLVLIKEENMMMTRCGTPCWTAPKVIKGQKSNLKADVYGFGIIMWEVITRKQPYVGRNFMGVSLDVLEGKWLQIPVDCPEAVAMQDGQEVLARLAPQAALHGAGCWRHNCKLPTVFKLTLLFTCLHLNSPLLA